MMRDRPLVKLWKEHKRRTAPRMQGTEQHALKQLERNRKAFAYPRDGFVHKIEFSLLYSMLSAPETYPKAVVHKMVDEEDFEQYMYTQEQQQEEGNNNSNNNNNNNNNSSSVSYAQLSAIMAFAAEKNPAPNATMDQTNSNNNDTASSEVSVSQKLCKKVLQTVVRYAEEHELDRETELEELLAPVKKVAAQRAEKSELKSMIPFYIGYTAALITANPLPLLVGTMGMASVSGNDQELKAMEDIVKESDRKADVERTGLLDEDEHS